MRKQGFTLIEVMIAMFIMAMLTVLVSSSIRTAVQNKKKLEAKIISETMLYDTLRIIKQDVERAFHYQDVFFEIEELAIQQLDTSKNQNGQNGQNGQGGNNNPVAATTNQRPPRPRPPKLTQFLGENNNMHFTALNHFRTKYNAPESDQMEVGYFLESCDRRDGEGSTQCLWRRSNPQIDDQVDQDGSKTPLAEHVTVFNLEYRSNQENDEWVKQWRSDNKGRADHRNKFPHFVKIELEIEDTEDQSVKKASAKIVVQVSFPNNEPHFQPQAAGGAPQQGGGRPQ